MEAARRWGIVFFASCCLWGIGGGDSAVAQNARTQNFLVYAPTQQLAQAVAEHAERYRDELAMHWLGRRLRPWSMPCPINVVAGPHLAAQGVTTYDRAPVGNFRMEVVGTPERILDSVLPHEINHTVLASHFGQPIPRWADEGICTTVEHAEERAKHEMKLREFLRTRRGIAMNQLFRLKEYPDDMLPLYAQGYSVSRFLIEQSGPQQFIKFIEGYLASGSWTENVQRHYGYESLAGLQNSWLAWVAQGSGPVEQFVSARTKAASAVASTRQASATTADGAVPASLASHSASPSPQSAVGQLAMNGPSGSRPAGSAAIPGPNDSPAAGWYLRRREQTAQGQVAVSVSPAQDVSPPTESTRVAIAPPSVSQSGRYSASQPQEELRFGQAPRFSSSDRTAALYR